MKKLKERLLLQRIQTDHNKDAFGELYDTYVTRMYRFIYFKVSNRQEAEDLTSELFLKLWEYATRAAKEQIESVNALLYRIARNLIIDHYRARAKQAAEYSLDAENAPDVASQENTVERVYADQEKDRLLKNLDQLKKEYQEIIILKYIEELDTKEIAAIMEKSRTGVRVTLHRAMKVLERLLREE